MGARVGALVTLFSTPNPLFGVQAGLVFEVSQERRSAPVYRSLSTTTHGWSLVRGRDTEPARGVQTGPRLRLEREGGSCENREPWTGCAQAGAGASASNLPLDLVLARILLMDHGELAPYFMCVLLCCVIVEVIIIIHNYLYFSNTIFQPRGHGLHGGPITHTTQYNTVHVQNYIFIHMFICVPSP